MTPAQNNDLVTVSSEVLINAPKSEVWKALYEHYGDVSVFHPKVEHSAYIAGGESGAPGVARVCSMNAQGSVYIKESITGVDDGNSFQITMTESKGVPFVEAYAQYRLADTGAGKTRVVQEISYRTKPALLGRIMKSKIGGDLGTVLVGLKYYLETGNRVSKTNAGAIIKAYRSLPNPGMAFTA